MERIIINIIFIVLSIHLLNAQNNNFELNKGNELYNNGKYEQAQSYFDQALEKDPNDHRALYNLANSFFRTENYENAENHYKNVAASAPSNKEKAAAYHNLGNTYLLQKKLDPAIEAYKDALRKNPHDEATRYNLSYALEMKKKQQEQKQDQNQDQQNKDDQKNQDEQDDQENKENQDNQDSQDNQEDKENKNDQQDQGKDDQQKNEDKKNKENKPQPNSISKEQAERMLDAINQMEKGIKKKVDEDEAKKKGIVNDEKDW